MKKATSVSVTDIKGRVTFIQNNEETSPFRPLQMTLLGAIPKCLECTNMCVSHSCGYLCADLPKSCSRIFMQFDSLLSYKT